MNLFSKRKIRLFTILQSAVMLLNFCPALHAMAAGEPNWHIAKTLYDTDSYIVAGYEARDFGITANGKSDVTSKIQEALNKLYALGGGTLFLPRGRYAVKGTLKIPQGVTLAGDWQNPDKNDGQAAGTILMAYSGRGNGDNNTNRDADPDYMPFITLEPNAHITGLNIWYPEQTPDDPVPYPTTVRMYDPKTWGADSTRISNITFINAYNAIRQGPNSSGCPNVSNVYIAPVHTAVEMDGLADVGRFNNIHVSPDYWINSGLDDAKENEQALRAYMMENATGIRLGRIDWSYLTFADIEGCKHGMEFVLSHSALSYENGNLDGTMTSWSYPNGQAYKINISDCDTGLYIEGCSGAGMLVAEMNIASCRRGLEMINGVESNGNLEISSSAIQGSEYAVYQNGLTRMCIGNSTIDGKIESQNSKLSIAGATYKNSSITFENNTDTVYNKKGDTVTKTGQVILSGGGLPEIHNLNDTSITQNDDAYIPPAVGSITEEPQLVTKPYKPDIFVVTDAPYNAPHNDVAFQQINAPCDEDASEAIQKALDDAEENGGGIVFCPPGRYTINKPLTVADGVELRGAVDHTRLPMKNGTVFDTPVPESKFLNTSFVELNSKTINGVENCLNGNTIFNEVPNPVIGEDGTVQRSATVTPYGLRLFSAANAEQSHVFDHTTQLECGKPDSKYIIEAVVSPKSIKANGEFFITLSRNEVTTNDDGTTKNNARNGFRIANFKANGNILELPGGVHTEFSNTEMYSFHWELDLTDISNKRIKTTVIATKSDKEGNIYTSETTFPKEYQGNSDNVGHILLQASKVNNQENLDTDSEIYVHGVSVKRNEPLNSPAWVTLRGGSGINGITFNCIGQRFLPSPSPSPYMICGDGANIYVRNIAFRNVYDGIDFKTNTCDNHYINGVAGIAWHSEIDIADSTDDVLANTQFNWGSLLYGSQSKLGCWEDSPVNDSTDGSGTKIDPRTDVNEPYMEKYLSMNLDCVTVDSCQNILLYDNFSIFGSSSLTMKGDTKGLCIGQGADASRLGMRVADSADVDFVNTQIVSFFYTDSSHITADPGYTGRCDFLNTSAWSTPSANIRAGGGELYIYNSTLNGVSRSVVSESNNDAYVYLQSGWVNNANTNSVKSYDGDGDIEYKDMFWNRAYTSLPAVPEAPEAVPAPAPRSSLTPRPGTFYPVVHDPIYTYTLDEPTEFNRIQLIWDTPQPGSAVVVAGGTRLESHANGVVLNLLNGCPEPSEAGTSADEFRVYPITAGSIEVMAAEQPKVRLFLDQKLTLTLTSSKGLGSADKMFDGIYNDFNTRANFDAVDSPEKVATASAAAKLDKEYDISKFVMYTWGPDGWYPKKCDIQLGDSSFSMESGDPLVYGYPAQKPYVLTADVAAASDSMTVTFPSGGYSDVRKNDTKDDGSVQNKYGFRIFEIELYGSEAPVWSSKIDVSPPEPTDTPTPEPTDTPTPEPTDTPTSEPTDTPTPNPTDTPTPEPTDTPTPNPTDTPSPEPTSTPDADDDEERLDISGEASDGITVLDISARLNEGTAAQPYMAILAVYDGGGRLLSVSMRPVPEAPSDGRLMFNNIRVPPQDAYDISLYRWEYTNNKLSMTPAAPPICGSYNVHN